MRWYGLLGGQVHMCVQSKGQTRGVRGYAPPRKLFFDLLVDAIWWNLGLFCTSIIYHLLGH